MDYETIVCLKIKGAKGHYNITLEAMPRGYLTSSLILGDWVKMGWGETSF